MREQEAELALQTLAVEEAAEGAAKADAASEHESALTWQAKQYEAEEVHIITAHLLAFSFSIRHPDSSFTPALHPLLARTHARTLARTHSRTHARKHSIWLVSTHMVWPALRSASQTLGEYR